MVKLRGLAWDHRRCWGPLDASVEPYRAAHPGVEIEWDRRSLYEFGEGALDPVLSTYDLVVFDHPFIGDIARGRLMVPFDDYLSEDQLSCFERDSVGSSWQSYAKDGHQWALPIDAACQVASYRPDLLSRYGQVPSSLDEVLELGRCLRKDGRWLGLPLVPTDAMCMLLTLTDRQEEGEEFFDAGEVVRAIDQLRRITALSHPDSPKWNPIRCYDHMIANDDVVYVPFAFGYVNYASKADAAHLLFADVPISGSAGALLGGAGLGVSAQSRHRQAAVDYALFLCSSDYQRGDYVTEGGQPGSLSAWKDETVNGLSRDFFKSTFRTVQSSYLRPTHSGFMTFFRECAPRVAAAIAGKTSASDLTSTLNRIYRETRSVDELSRSVA